MVICLKNLKNISSDEMKSLTEYYLISGVLDQDIIKEIIGLLSKVDINNEDDAKNYLYSLLMLKFNNSVNVYNNQSLLSFKELSKSKNFKKIEDDYIQNEEILFYLMICFKKHSEYFIKKSNSNKTKPQILKNFIDNIIRYQVDFSKLNNILVICLSENLKEIDLSDINSVLQICFQNISLFTNVSLWNSQLTQFEGMSQHGIEMNYFDGLTWNSMIRLIQVRNNLIGCVLFGRRIRT